MKAAKEISQLSAEELQKRLGEFKKELLKLNVQVATGANPSSPGRMRQVKKSSALIYGKLHSNNKEVSLKTQ